MLGGLLAFVWASVYFFYDCHIAKYSSLMILLGVTATSIGLLQFKFRNFSRLIANTIFVLGSLLILIGTDELIQSIFFDLFVICLIVFWLLTRITLSQWDHEMICSSCNVENCSYTGNKKKEGLALAT